MPTLRPPDTFQQMGVKGASSHPYRGLFALEANEQSIGADVEYSIHFSKMIGLPQSLSKGATPLHAAHQRTAFVFSSIFCVVEG